MSENNTGSIEDYTIDEIKELEAENETLKQENAQLKEDLAKAQKADTKKLQKDLDAALAEVADLAGLLDAQESNAQEGVKVVVIKKKKYKLLGQKFSTPKGVEYTANELANDQDELERMLKIKSGSLIEITG